MLWAAFLTCFFGFFRLGEICSTQPEGFDPASDLSADSVMLDNICNPCRVRIRLQTSKIDPFREGAIITLPRMEDDLCPVTALLSWLNCVQEKILRPAIRAAVRSTTDPSQASQGTQECAIGTRTGSRTFLGPQFQKRGRNNGSGLRYPRLTDKDPGPVEELGISTLHSPLRKSGGQSSGSTFAEFQWGRLPATYL